MTIKYKKTKDGDTRVTFENGKILSFTEWDVKTVKQLAKNSKTIKWLFSRTANLVSVDNKILSSTEETDTRKHFFYIAVRNIMSAMTRHGYTLDELIKMESIIMADKLNKEAIMEYALEKDIRVELADAVRLHSYR